MSGKSLFQLHVERWSGGCGSELCQHATKVCLYRGQIPCDVLFVGEAPGQSEDTKGVPFWGPAGDVLQQVIDNVVPDDVRWGMTNVVGCIPLDDEHLGKTKSGGPPMSAIKVCSTRLVEIVRLAKPKVIICVGTVSYETLRVDCKPAYKVKGQRIIDVDEHIPRVHVMHPAAIMRVNKVHQSLLYQQLEINVASAVHQYVTIPTSKV